MDTMDRSTFRYYQHNAGELARRYETAEVSGLHRRLLETFPAGSKLLEIGCGSGREAAFLTARGFEVYCIEPAPQMIGEALRCHPELEGRLFEGSLPGDPPEEILGGSAGLQAHEGSYDGIYAVASLMHLSKTELADTFLLLRSTLKAGGRFLFSVPLTRPDLEESGYDRAGRYFLLLPEEEWTGALTAAGFSGIRTATTPDGMGRGSVTWLTCTAEK